MAVEMDKLYVFLGKFVGDLGEGWWKRHELFARSHQVLAVAVFACALFASSPAYSQSTSNDDDRVVLELSALGKRGDTIVRAREQVLDILKNENACTAWFQEADPEPAEVFRSLHFELEMEGPSYVYSMRDGERGELLKHPWAARSIEYAGRNSTIQLNANGTFFKRSSVVMQLDPKGMLARPQGIRLLTTYSYEGNTPKAQIAILLHELGHIIGRLPEDDDSWDGRSSRNTSEVLRHCKAETRAGARTSPRGSIKSTIPAF